MASTPIPLLQIPPHVEQTDFIQVGIRVRPSTPDEAAAGLPWDLTSNGLTVTHEGQERAYEFRTCDSWEDVDYGSPSFISGLEPPGS